MARQVVWLERRKIYEVLRDTQAEQHKQLIVVDESGEDYLYLTEVCAAIELSQPLRRAVLAAA
jgi:prophage antirepressor-like protein